MAKTLPDDAVDNRDVGTTWLWPDGYGVGTPIEVTKEDVVDILKGFYENGPYRPDDVEVIVVQKKRSNRHAEVF